MTTTTMTLVSWKDGYWITLCGGGGYLRCWYYHYYCIILCVFVLGGESKKEREREREDDSDNRYAPRKEVAERRRRRCTEHYTTYTHNKIRCGGQCTLNLFCRRAFIPTYKYKNLFYRKYKSMCVCVCVNNSHILLLRIILPRHHSPSVYHC